MLQVRRLRWGTKAPVNLAANTIASSANRRCATSGAFGRRRRPGAMESSTSSACQGYSAEIQVQFAYGPLRAKYKCLSRRFSSINVWTQDKNRCSPSKPTLPSNATNFSVLFSRA